ncbi:helix-turn-helix transcriptional regulator [Tenacibaculum aiptasiae]|uniref:helix-turn-helix transcriptional regulator n=1 Tax=Tenacibaculum aiptasiae TaxID=426481 RepID=UPI0023309EAA|nr:helix-turn-helix transcriptional regulator [Tenacibaculum aiptasiae]
MEINRIKVVLAETKRKNKWLAKQLNKDEATISQWCTNSRQPSLGTLLNIANVLNVDIRVLLNSTTKNS